MNINNIKKGSLTEENLKKGFAGESQAAISYMFYASKAKKDGYEEIASILDEIAHNEIEHAKIWYKILNGGILDTLENVKAASKGEKYEWETMYKDFAKTAREEGYEEVAKLFEGVANIEKSHESIYNILIERLEKEKMFESENECCWICKNCGHIHFGKKAPQVCPVCSHPKAFFQRRDENLY